MTSSTTTRTRRWPLWLTIAVGTTVGLLAAAGIVIVLTTLGIIAVSAGDHDEDARDRALALLRTDPAGSTACVSLDGFLVMGGGTFDEVRLKAIDAGTAEIRRASTVDELYTACVAAGANMSRRR